MTPFRRWCVVAAGTLLLVGAPVALRLLPAADSDVSAGRLLEQARAAEGHAWSGFVETDGYPPAARRGPVQRRRCSVRRAHQDAGVVAGRRPLAGRPAPAHRRDRPRARGRDDPALGLRAPRRHAEPGPRHPAAPDRRPRAPGARRAAAARGERRRRTTRPRPAGSRSERAGAAGGAGLRPLEHRPRRPVAGPGLRRTAPGRGVRRRDGHRRLHQRVPGVLERPSRQRAGRLRPAGRRRRGVRRRPRHRGRCQPVRPGAPARHGGRARRRRRRRTARWASTAPG